ncbi:MAG: DUF3142 domain-containing protein [Bryobacteraceae bacterium]
MKRALFAAALTAALVSCSRGAGGPKPERWSNAFWLWGDTAVESAVAVDELFVLAGTVRKGGTTLAGGLPERIPPAGAYWLAFRFYERTAPRPLSIQPLVNRIAELRKLAAARKLAVAGVQLDVDCPTRQLAAYAEWLSEFRKALGADVPVSITALLDWFRPGTEMQLVADAVDEYVPQFYDAGADAAPTISAPVMSPMWSARFQELGRRYRIGISTFGRVRFREAANRGAVYEAGGARPVDLALHSALTRRASRTRAGELRLVYTASRAGSIAGRSFLPGDAFEIIAATPESIFAGMEQAMKMGDYCAGVVFFRWPEAGEALTAQPAEVLRAAGGEPVAAPLRLRVSEGGCPAASCADVGVVMNRPFSEDPVRYRIVSTARIEYFVPADGSPARLISPYEIGLEMPPFSGRGLFAAGRAVTGSRSKYSIEELR